MELFGGVGVALITPMNEKGIDYAETEKLLEHTLSGGADALFALGTTGEPSTLTAAERTGFLQFVLKTVRGRVPVFAGTGSNNTADAVEKSVAAERLGADGLLVVTPYYNKCTQNGLYEHYKKIDEAVGIPIVVYNVPPRTRVNIEPATAVRLAGLKNVRALKEANGEIDHMLDMIAAVKDTGLTVYSGDDSLTSVAMSLGAKGVISVAANIVPAEMKKLTDLCAAGDYAAAAAQQLRLLPFLRALFCEVNPIPAKKAAEFIGIRAGKPRLPLTEMEPAHAERLRRTLIDLGVIGGA